MAITAAGVGSGLDIESIVSQLMSLERQPLVALQRRESDTRAQISAYGTLKSAVSAFRDAMQDLGTLDAFRIFQADSSDEEVMTASADGDAANGIYNIDVARRAQNHKMGSDAFAEGTTFGGAAGDSLTLTVDGASSVIDLTEAKTLAGVRDAINSASDNPGVTATILNVGGGEQRLILTASESGSAKRVELGFGGAMTAGSFNFATTNRDSEGVVLTDLAELDAAFTIDGFDLTSASNSVTGVIDGLNIELQGEGSAVLDVTRDNEAIQASAQAFVDAYNKVLSTVSDLRNGQLSGDSTLRSIQSRMRAVLNTPPTGLSGTFDALSQLGIKTNGTTGRLEFDDDTFNAALETDFAAVAQLFANNDQGYAFRFDALAGNFLDDEGLIETRVDGLDSRARRLEDAQSELERRLDLREVALRRQYAALDQLVGSLQSTNTFLLQNFFS